MLTSTGEGRQSFVRETHQDQLHNRARGPKTPRSRLADSTTQYVSARAHFHPLPCLAQTSRFITPGLPKRMPNVPHHPALRPYRGIYEGRVLGVRERLGAGQGNSLRLRTLRHRAGLRRPSTREERGDLLLETRVPPVHPASGCIFTKALGNE